MRQPTSRLPALRRDAFNFRSSATLLPRPTARILNFRECAHSTRLANTLERSFNSAEIGVGVLRYTTQLHPLRGQEVISYCRNTLRRQ
jgi:hypothetical protein